MTLALSAIGYRISDILSVRSFPGFGSSDQRNTDVAAYLKSIRALQFHIARVRISALRVINCPVSPFARTGRGEPGHKDHPDNWKAVFAGIRIMNVGLLPAVRSERLAQAYDLGTQFSVLLVDLK